MLDLGFAFRSVSRDLGILRILLDLLGLTVGKTEDYPGESLAPVLLESGREPQKDYVLGAYYVPESRKERIQMCSSRRRSKKRSLKSSSWSGCWISIFDGLRSVSEG